MHKTEQRAPAYDVFLCGDECAFTLYAKKNCAHNIMVWWTCVIGTKNITDIISLNSHPYTHGRHCFNMQIGDSGDLDKSLAEHNNIAHKALRSCAI